MTYIDHVVTEAEANGVAAALALATAIAVAQIYAACEVENSSYACREASYCIEDSALALAKVFLLHLLAGVCAVGFACKDSEHAFSNMWPQLLSSYCALRNGGSATNC
jgi:hypothetical protein